jgi:uncharacterized protein (TIGR03089 family)
VTPADLLRREHGRDGARPLLTWYDDDSGARVELSVATTANWVAKIAGLLADEHDVVAGTVVSVDLPLHWQTACVLLAVWSCGGAVDVGGATAPRVGVGDEADLRVAPDPMGVGLSRLVGGEPDEFVPVVPIDVSALALRVGGREWSHAELGAAALHAASHHGLGEQSRVLSTMAYDSVDGVDAGLLVPLAAGGSVVLVTNVERSTLAERCARENVTHTAGIVVKSLPRLD